MNSKVSLRFFALAFLFVSFFSLIRTSQAVINIQSIHNQKSQTSHTQEFSFLNPRIQVPHKVEIIGQKNHKQKFDSALSATEFTFHEIKKKVTLILNGKPESNYLTDTRAAYRTKSLSNIEDYGIVQWIKGCQFESILEKNNQVTQQLTVSRHHFGKIIPFKHTSWEIDSDSEDPIYSSYSDNGTDYGRHALLRWNKNPESLDPETAVYYAAKKPEVLRVFATDMPGTAFLEHYEIPDENGVLIKKPVAKNTSLELKTCLYKMSDLPLKTDPKGQNIDETKALACFSWDHKFVYDFKAGKFKTTGPIDSFCQ